MYSISAAGLTRPSKAAFEFRFSDKELSIQTELWFTFIHLQSDSSADRKTVADKSSPLPLLNWSRAFSLFLVVH